MKSRSRLMLVAGARPNFMKIAPLLREIQARADRFEHILVHTGQHYDEGMSDVFFQDLGIPHPDHHLNVGSGSHALQTAAIMTAFEPVLTAVDPDCVLVFGDINSTLACSIVAKKLGYLVGHVEAGLRSGDLAMPEEINRIVTDAISDFFFVTESSGMRHLQQEGKPPERLFHVGHVMIDNLLYEVEKLARMDTAAMQTTQLKARHPRYGVVTLHRPSNVDEEGALRDVLGALARVATELPLIFPVHPRTRANMQRFGVEVPESIVLVDPLGYKEFLNLWRDAVLVLTDSGGLQEETTGLGIPCLTLRSNTERPVTVDEGSNQIVGTDPQRIVSAALAIVGADTHAAPPRRPALWDGRASVRILDILAERL